jgi:hypothetical protein
MISTKLVIGTDERFFSCYVTYSKYTVFVFLNFLILLLKSPVTVAERSNARAVFARPDAVIMGSNHLGHGSLVCICVYSVSVLSCLATSSSLVQGVLPIVNRSGKGSGPTRVLERIKKKRKKLIYDAVSIETK